MRSTRIKSIIPAPGWYAVHRTDDGTFEKTPVVCWALMQDDDIQYVSAIGVGRGTDATDYEEADLPNFVTLVHENDPPEWLATHYAEFNRLHPIPQKNKLPAAGDSQDCETSQPAI